MSTPSSRNDRLSRSAVLLVHGIGPFDQSATEDCVKAFCERAGLHRDSLLCVNWDRLVLEHIASASFAGVLGSLGKGVTTAVHRTFSAGAISRRAIEWAHIFTSLAIPWLIVGLFLPVDRWRIFFLAAWSATMAVSLVLAFVDRVSVVGAAGRTIALPLTWSFIHLAVFPATRDAWKIFLPLAGLLAAIGLPFEVAFWMSHRMPQGRISETTLDMLTGQWSLWPWLTVTALWFGMFSLLGIATRALLQKPLRLLLDIFRYAGDSEMRNAVQVHLHRSVCSQFSAPRTHLVFLTHSLGSVIVVDT